MEEKIDNYTFGNLEIESSSEGSEEVQVADFNFQNIIKKKSVARDALLKKERESAEREDFKISPIVVKHRGLHSQKLKEEKERIDRLVYHEVEQVREEVVEQSYTKGLEKGRLEVVEQEKDRVDQCLKELRALTERFKSREENLVEEQKVEVYSMIKMLVRWIILRELKDDGEYIDRLVKKLISESKGNSILHFKVGKDVAENVKYSVGKLYNELGKEESINVSIDPNLGANEIDLVRSDSIVKADLDNQLKSLDELFSALGVFD